jgi:glycosyltransferase involved in cell wall biosynthesis
LRFLYPKVTSVYRSLAAADADIYYVRTASFLTTVVSHFCENKGKRWVYAGAHDTDFLPGKELVPNIRDRWLYRRGLRKADEIIVQSEKQRELLGQHYKRDSVLIHNFINDGPSTNSVPEDGLVLWVSTIRRWKRPELLFEMARSLPEYKFVMVGGPDALDRRYYLDIERQAQAVANVEFLGFQPFNEVEKLFDKAVLFVNTSEHEGFPNTFLQAWRRGLPVITCFDPDNVVSICRLGRKIHNVAEAIDMIPKMCRTDLERTQYIRNYFLEHHSNKVVNKYLDVFERLV